jgi:DNA-binding NtrC family response regulator
MLRVENTLLKREIEADKGFENFVGRSPAMEKVFDLITRVAEKNSTVLITGESGTGKELAARAIHNKSPRKDKPFVYIHCGRFRSSFWNQSFRPYEGSFTGAFENKEGLLRLHRKGRYFLTR